MSGPQQFLAFFLLGYIAATVTLIWLHVVLRRR